MALAVLANTTMKLQVLLAGAVATSECPGTIAFRDIKKDAIGGSARATPVNGADDFITTGNTAVDVCDPPPTGIRREVTGLTLYNDDTTSVTVTVRVYVNASTTRIVFYGTLLTNESLFYTEDMGFFALNANGERKLSSSADISASSSQASSLAAAIVVASVNSVSSQASSMAALVPHTVSSQASSIAATNPHTVSSLQSLASVQSFTATNWSTVSSAVSRVKSSFTW